MEANGLQRVRIWVDVEESTGQVVALELRCAFHDPGCPVCRVRQQSVHRYLFGLLWEDVNNHPRTIPVLACATVQRLEGLAGDLGEYVRKHAWEYRHERVTEEEQISVHRMSQLVGGLDRYALELGRPEPASQGLTRDRLKQMGLRIDE